MGKRSYRGKKRGSVKKPRTDEGENGNEKQGEWKNKFNEWVYTNEKFVEYYKAQNIIPEGEWEKFMEYLGKPLPTTFRINNTCLFSEEIRKKVEKDFKFDGLVIEEKSIEPICNLKWYPKNNGFQWSVERRKVRKVPLLDEFKRWLMELTDSGNITRQEAVSMIPPLVLGVKSHHKVLDMCAAPGSKTSQLLELIHADHEVTGKIPTGVVVANDVDIKRAQMLVHQVKRIGSPGLIVTCHEAQNFPFLKSNDSESDGGVFDRILCDAPCSGDGTLRKNPIIWRNWDVKNGLSLHGLQLQIAQRGASLLKIGGLMCYSTCTFNPIENEAVVAELLRWADGSLELCDVAESLPLLKRQTGISNWRVYNSKMESFDAFSDVPDEINSKLKNPICRTMFPPTDEEAKKFNLDLCMRCLPQDENTGGFFICLLKKTGAITDIKESNRKKRYYNNLREKMEKKESVEESNDKSTSEEKKFVEKKETEENINQEEGASVAPSKVNYRGRKKITDDYIPLSNACWKEIQEFYGIKDFKPEHFYSRSEGENIISLVTESVAANLLGQMQGLNMKVVHAGIKAFEKNDSPANACKYRLTQAGGCLMVPRMSNRVLKVASNDFQLLLDKRGDLLNFTDFSEKTSQYFLEASVGSVICALDRKNSTPIEEMMMSISVWRGRSSINTMIGKVDATALIATLKSFGLYVEKQEILDEKKIVEENVE